MSSSNNNGTPVMSPGEFYANRHIPSFLALCYSLKDGTSIANEKQAGKVSSCRIQVLHDGRNLTAKALLEGTLDISQPILVKDAPESIGMTVFRPPDASSSLGEDSRNKIVTVRHVADEIGHLYPVRVMDVEHQEELKGWTMGDLVDYFEDGDRLQQVMARKWATQQREQQQQTTTGNNQQTYHLEEFKDDKLFVAKPTEKLHGGTTYRSQRKAAQKASSLFFSDQNRPKILNQISLEFSDTPLGKKVVSPQFVRDLDWIDNCWPSNLRQRYNKQSYPSVQYYCLTSTAGCFTDFHVDFGGTAVWYHVLSGSKQFCLIKPTKQNLAIYEEWLMHSDQESQFLADKIPNQSEVLTVKLQASQTLFIPTGWIHAVYTPDDSVVLGGNFLHGFDLDLQLEIDGIENRTKTPDKFRFPYFRKLHFYVAGNYLHRLRNNITLSSRELKHIPALLSVLEAWMEEASLISPKTSDFQDTASAVAEINGCASVFTLLQALRSEHWQATNGTKSVMLQGPTTTESNEKHSNPFGRQGLNIVPPDGPPSIAHNAKSLGSPKSPKIRLKLSSKKRAGVRESMDPASDSGFRITIASTSKELHKPLPRTAAKKTKFREETEFVDLAKDDDDWVPTSSSLQLEHEDFIIKNSNNKTKRAGSKGGSPAIKKRGTGQTPTRTLGVKKPKTTSRQRLLKKFR